MHKNKFPRSNDLYKKVIWSNFYWKSTARYLIQSLWWPVAFPPKMSPWHVELEHRNISVSYCHQFSNATHTKKWKFPYVNLSSDSQRPFMVSLLFFHILLSPFLCVCVRFVFVQIIKHPLNCRANQKAGGSSKDMARDP